MTLDADDAASLRAQLTSQARFDRELRA
jgi:hypothetical protein